MAGQVNSSASRPLQIAALGFVVLALGYVAIASPLSTSAWDWASCVLGPLIIVVAVLSHRSALSESIGAPALVLFLIALILVAGEYVPGSLSIDSGSSGWAAFPYELWGAGWIVSAFGVIAVIARKQSRQSPSSLPQSSYAQLSLLSSGMMVYGIGFEELGSDRLSHGFGAVAFGGAVLIALSIIAQRRTLTTHMGAAAANIVIFIVTAWAVKDVTREIGSLMANATFSKEMIFGLGAIFYVLAAVACVLVSRRGSTAKSA